MRGLRLTPEQAAALQARNWPGGATVAKPSAEAPTAPANAPERKYHNVPTADGHASRRESRRAAELRALEAAGKISDLQEQVRFELIPAQYIDGKCVERAVTYTADFTYREDGKLVVEDTKGLRTQQYVIRRKLMLYMRGIRVRET